MWLSRQMTGRERQTEAGAEIGLVTIGGDAAGVLARGEQRDLPSAAPGGYAWQPTEGDQVVLLRGGTLGQEQCILGVVQDNARRGLAPGEVCLYTDRASIRLRPDGRIDIDGEVYIQGERYLTPSQIINSIMTLI